MPPPRVVIESPYYSSSKVDQDRNIEYALECLRDSFGRREAPFASHLLYTRVLDDAKAEERSLGLRAALEWIGSAKHTAVYIDRGVSPGVRLGLQSAARVQVRSLRRDVDCVHRLQNAFDGRPSSLAVEQCLPHRLDTPVTEDYSSGRLVARRIVGWRCGCGAVRREREPLP